MNRDTGQVSVTGAEALRVGAGGQGLVLEFAHVGYRADERGFEIVRDISFGMEPAEYTCIVGPSGCGKTTTLLLAGGHLQPTTGEVFRKSERAAMAFQTDTLFGHQRVIANLRFGWERRPNSAAQSLTPEQMLRLVGLENYALFYPRQLSAGMKARVQLARTWLAGTELCLLDEPLSQLDIPTKQALETLIEKMYLEERRTVLHVAHDLEEVLMVGCRVLVMHGPPAQIVRDITVPFPRPRPPELRFSREFQELRAELMADLAVPR